MLAMETSSWPVGSKNRRGGYGKTIKKKGSPPAPELKITWNIAFFASLAWDNIWLWWRRRTPLFSRCKLFFLKKITPNRPYLHRFFFFLKFCFRRWCARHRRTDRCIYMHMCMCLDACVLRGLFFFLQGWYGKTI